MMYKAKFSTPSPISEYIQEIQSAGEVISITDAVTTVRLEASDDYELATTVRELAVSLGGMVGHVIDIPRPVLENPS